MTEHATDWQRELRARGYRSTPQRQLVLEAVSALGHATPEEILTEVRRKARGVNASTIYRTLDLLEDLGLVTHTHLGHGAPTYHPGDAPPHAHLVCDHCGRVIEVEADALEPLVATLRQRYAFSADIRHLTIQGSCAACQAEAPERPTEAPEPQG